MLDPQFVKDNPDKVSKAIKDRGMVIDMPAFLKLDEKRKKLLQKVETLRAKRNSGSKGKPTEKQRTQLKKLSENIKKEEEKLSVLEWEHKQILLSLPNIPHKSVGVGVDDTENKKLRSFGKKPKIKNAKEHFEIDSIAQYFDLDRGARVSGSRFYYLRGPIAKLEHALMRYAVDFITKEGYELLVTPILVGESALEGTGYFPNGRSEVYNVNPGKDDLFLIGTSEQAITAFHGGEVLDELPVKYAAQSPCFRREAGSYGKDTRGVLRVHQFNKVEMMVFCEPEKSWQMLDEIIALSEKFYQSLEIPYQVMQLCTGDLGFQAAKTIDIEAWFPGQKKYRELGSASNTTDFQTRRLKIKNKEKKFVHTLNNTVVSDRTLLAVLENYQNEDGSVDIPKALQKYAGFKKIKKT